MKRKSFIISIVIFISISIVNLSIVKTYSRNDVSLDLVSVMSKAYDEGESASIKRYCYEGTQDPELGSGPQEFFRMCTSYPGPLACSINIGWIIGDKEECIYQVE